VLLLDRLVNPVVVTFPPAFVQGCRISDLHPSAPYLSKSLPTNLFMIIGFQISSYAQIVNQGLTVFPEHVTPNLAPLHLVPDSSSLTLECQVCLRTCQVARKLKKIVNCGFGMLEIVISMQCNCPESDYLVNWSFRRACSTCWTSLRMCNLWKLKYFRWWARHAALRMVSVILVAATSRHHHWTRQRWLLKPRWCAKFFYTCSSNRGSRSHMEIELMAKVKWPSTSTS
jgi:hypothetical protein